MNVLFAYGFCGRGGVKTAVLNRADALRRRGIGVMIVFRQFYGEGAMTLADLPHVRVVRITLSRCCGSGSTLFA